jgi:hypothetical protein
MVVKDDPKQSCEEGPELRPLITRLDLERTTNASGPTAQGRLVSEVRDGDASSSRLGSVMDQWADIMILRLASVQRQCNFSLPWLPVKHARYRLIITNVRPMQMRQSTYAFRVVEVAVCAGRV